MHVLHLIARLNDGGPARVLMALVPALRAQGIHTRIIAGTCATDEPDMTDQVRAAGITVETLPLLRRATTPWNDVRAFMAIVCRIKTLRPTVVHTHTAKAGVLGRIACRLLGVPCVHTYHGHVLNGYFPTWINKGLHVAERLVAGSCAHHALTTTQRQELASHYCIGRRARWHVLPIPVEPPQTKAAAWQDKLSKGVPVIGFLGRLVAVKDVCLWLDVLADIARHMPVQGLICGDGSEQDVIREKIKTLQVPVVMTGFIPAGEALHVMDVLLLTSRNEGLPVTVIEAAGCQSRAVPVVAPPVGGLRDLIRAGVVIGAHRQATALSAACRRVLSDSVYRQRRIAKAQHYAQQLAPARLARAYAHLYQCVQGKDSYDESMDK